MSAMFAGVAFTVVFSIPALVREIRLARRYESPAAVRPSWPAVGIALVRVHQTLNCRAGLHALSRLLAEPVRDGLGRVGLPVRPRGWRTSRRRTRRGFSTLQD
jgi:hypothetical protein